MSVLERNASEWEANARRNALWAILTDRDRTEAAWDAEAFFATGRVEVDGVLRALAAAGAGPNFQGCFLDFGCGVGRNTRALAQRFAAGIGIDVSETMIALARQYSEDDTRRAAYSVNRREGLPDMPDGCIDFVYCHIVLQHLPPALQPVFIREFLRILKPGGIAAFQVPTEDLASRVQCLVRWGKSRLRATLPSWLTARIRKLLGRGSEAAPITMDMNLLPERRVAAIIRQHGCSLLAAPYTNSTDTSHRGALRFMTRHEALTAVDSGVTDSRLLSQFFFVRKPAP
ncbi:class I SAM-dependent methyltransferase [Desertibaculum subflavum]|uniref:class I SAM-dependent methyltransferase n=1 Tax=Desertibaculum subflavum TaxID=2268458 RepID=UPI000E672253